MMSVLLACRPQYCAKIFNGEKTIEVRRTRPKIDTPFEVLVYETKAQFVKSIRGACTTYGYGRGKVIGSFVCDRVRLCIPFGLKGHLLSQEVYREMCLTKEQLDKYGGLKTLYGWHITEPKLFDKPRELGEFFVPCKEYDSDKPHCWECDYYSYSPNDSGDAQEECLCGGCKRLSRPPMSWQYVEDHKEEIT